MLTAQDVSDANPVAMAAAVGLMLGLEGLSPLVPLLPGRERARHLLRNVAIALCTSLFAVGGSFVLVWVAAWAHRHAFGLLNQVELPWLVRFVIALVVIDFFEWVRHRLHHYLPVLWRLHRVHHTDPHVDATTALRGHPLESVIAYAWFSIWVVLLGVDPLSLACRTFLAVIALAWHHADLKLPAGLDAAISLVTPTPRTHRLHHSRDVRFADSNFGTLFTWWDRLLGTFAPGSTPPQPNTGIDGFDSEHAQSLWGVLTSPLVAPRPITETKPELARPR